MYALAMPQLYRHLRLAGEPSLEPSNRLFHLALCLHNAAVARLLRRLERDVAPFDDGGCDGIDSSGGVWGPGPCTHLRTLELPADPAAIPDSLDWLALLRLLAPDMDDAAAPPLTITHLAVPNPSILPAAALTALLARAPRLRCLVLGGTMTTSFSSFVGPTGAAVPAIVDDSLLAALPRLCPRLTRLTIGGGCLATPAGLVRCARELPALAELEAAGLRGSGEAIEWDGAAAGVLLAATAEDATTTATGVEVVPRWQALRTLLLSGAAAGSRFLIALARDGAGPALETLLITPPPPPPSLPPSVSLPRLPSSEAVAELDARTAATELAAAFPRLRHVGVSPARLGAALAAALGSGLRSLRLRSGRRRRRYADKSGCPDELVDADLDAVGRACASVEMIRLLFDEDGGDGDEPAQTPSCISAGLMDQQPLLLPPLPSKLRDGRGEANVCGGVTAAGLTRLVGRCSGTLTDFGCVASTSLVHVVPTVMDASSVTSTPIVGPCKGCHQDDDPYRLDADFFAAVARCGRLRRLNLTGQAWAAQDLIAALRQQQRLEQQEQQECHAPPPPPPLAALEVLEGGGPSWGAAAGSSPLPPQPASSTPFGRPRPPVAVSLQAARQVAYALPALRILDLRSRARHEGAGGDAGCWLFAAANGRGATAHVLLSAATATGDVVDRHTRGGGCGGSGVASA
ncbi:hypothetical protein HK405_002874 [Cladochytrium tenue]|nr:hypothetical protein HK405_002874 [Cladochytrium tenue]